MAWTSERDFNFTITRGRRGHAYSFRFVYLIQAVTRCLGLNVWEVHKLLRIDTKPKVNTHIDSGRCATNAAKCVFSIGKTGGTDAAKCVFSIKLVVLMRQNAHSVSVKLVVLKRQNAYSVSVNLVVMKRQNVYSIQVKLSDGTSAAKCTYYLVSVNFLIVLILQNAHIQYR